MHQFEGKPTREKSLARQMQHDGGIFANGVQHHRIVELGGDLPDDVNALCFELFEMGKYVV
jgi:hypothetical protein